MSQVPARLVYENTSNNDEVIGSFQPQDVTSGNISTFTVDESARNYTKVIIEGAPTLEDKMPTTLSDFGTSEPEIRVEIDSNLDGTWETRARVYPEESGTTNNRGRYKNKNLWGFKKYYGEDSVNTGTLTSTDLTAAVEALLPSGYTAVYPGDITAPTISEYSYRGARQQGFNELQREYQHFFFFTTATDGNGDYIVRVQPKGYGGEEQSFVRGQDAYTYNYWKKNDLSNVISRVNIVGKDSNNQKVDLTFQAGSDTGDPEVDTYLTGLDDPDRDRFKRLHIDQTINSSDAQTIAENFLQPTGTQHGKIEAGLVPQSTLNDSVGILDNDRGIDDIFTVVKQKDFFHEGITQYSFEFEQEATDEQRDKWREHDNERAKIYPSNSTDVGNQEVTTGDAEGNTSKLGGVGLDTDRDDNTSNVGRGTGGVSERGVSMQLVASDSNNAGGGTTTLSPNATINLDDTANSFAESDNKHWVFRIDTDTQLAEFTIVGIIGGLEVYRATHQTAGDGDLRITPAVLASVNLSGVGVDVDITNKSGSDVDFSFAEFEVYGEEAHDHTDDINPANNEMGLDDDITPVDNNHGGGTGDDQHGGSTESNVNVETSTEDNTGRSQ